MHEASARCPFCGARTEHESGVSLVAMQVTMAGCSWWKLYCSGQKVTLHNFVSEFFLPITLEDVSF